MVKTKIYLDACPLIDLLKEKAQLNLNNDIKNHNHYTNKLICLGKKGQIELYTSFITICECMHTQKGDIQPNQEIQNLCDSLLLSQESGITLSQINLQIIKKARAIRWEHGINIKRAPDMIHLASALNINCHEFITLDKRIISLSKDFEKLNLQIKEPATSQLFLTGGGQGDLFNN